MSIVRYYFNLLWFLITHFCNFFFFSQQIINRAVCLLTRQLNQHYRYDEWINHDIHKNSVANYDNFEEHKCISGGLVNSHSRSKVVFSISQNHVSLQFYVVNSHVHTILLIQNIFIPSKLVMGGTPFNQTTNELECVHLLIIELEHLNFGFKRTDIEHRTLKAFTIIYLIQRMWICHENWAKWK